MAKRHKDLNTATTTKADKTLESLVIEAKSLESYPNPDFNKTVNTNKVKALIQAKVGSILGNIINSLNQPVEQPETEPSEAIERSIQLLEKVDKIPLSPYMKHAMQWVYDELVAKEKLILVHKDGVESELVFYKNKYKNVDIARQSSRFLISEILPQLVRNTTHSIRIFMDMWQQDYRKIGFYQFVDQMLEDTTSAEHKAQANNLTMKMLKNHVIHPSLLDTLDYCMSTFVKFDS
jgi:hypothetical protein